MKFRIQKADFLRGLRLAQGIVDRKSNIPILANVLLRTDGMSKLMLAATDLSISICVELLVEVDRWGGLTVNAKHLQEIVASLPGEDVVVRLVDNRWAEIHADGADYRLDVMADREFPVLPDPREAQYGKVAAPILRDMIEKTIFSVSNDETRFHLNGVLFECDGAKALMVSTDGHRLSKVERTLAGAPKLHSGVIIPKKGLTEIKRLIKGAKLCDLAIQGPNLFCRVPGASLAIKLIDSQFPRYAQAIPKSSNKEVVLNRLAFSAALKRGQLMSREIVRFSFEKGRLRISGADPELGKVDLEIDYNGKEATIGFNARYLLELLGQMDSTKIRFAFSGEEDPAVVTPAEGAEYLGVIMPARI